MYLGNNAFVCFCSGGIYKFMLLFVRDAIWLETQNMFQVHLKVLDPFCMHGCYTTPALVVSF